MSKIIRHHADQTGVEFSMIKQYCHTSVWQLLTSFWKQPLFSEDGKLVLAANGDLHRELRKQLRVNIAFKQKVIVK
jgi:asparagine synthase (glutamine-hydrolysing)